MHGRMLVQHLFNFSGINIFSAADEQILLAINDVEISFVIEVRQIACVKESTLIDSGFGRFWIIELARAL